MLHRNLFLLLSVLLSLSFRATAKSPSGSSGAFGTAGGFSNLQKYRVEDILSGDSFGGEQGNTQVHADLGWFSTLNNSPLFLNSSISFTGRVDQAISLSYEDLVARANVYDPDGDEVVILVTSRAGSFSKTIPAQSTVILHRGQTAQWFAPANIDNLHQLFDFQVSDLFGSSPSAAQGLSFFKPLILNSPASKVLLKAGESFVMHANLSGSLPMLMQWDKSGENINMATAPNLTIANAARPNSGLYSLYAKNDFGAAYAVIYDVSVQVPEVIDSPQITASSVTISFTDSDGAALARFNENDFVVWRSQDLISWVPIPNAILKFNNGKFEFTDSEPPVGRRFYKIESK